MTSSQDELRNGSGTYQLSSSTLPDRHRSRSWLAKIPHFSAVILAVFSALCLLWSVSPGLRFLSRMPRDYLDDHFFHAPDTSVVWALVVALLAAAIAARKRIAWLLLVVYLVAWFPGNAVGIAEHRGFHALAGLVVHVLALGVLLAAWREFYTRVRPGSVRRALSILVGGLLAGCVVGWGLVELFPGSLPAGLQRPLWATYRVTATLLAESEQFDGAPPPFVDVLLGVFGALALLAAAAVLLRSQQSQNAMTGLDESAIRGLLDRSDIADSLGYFATRRDKSVVFAPNGRAAITYRVELGVCLASGDPVGTRGSWPQAIDAWLSMAERFGWAPAVMGASEAGAEAYRRSGLSALRLGEEAVLDTRNFSLAGAEMKPVRQAANRLRNRGVSVCIRRHRDIPAAEFRTISGRAERWRDTESERGFSMALGRLGDPLDGDCLLVEAIDSHDQVLGMLSLVPWGRTGVSLELMRRDPHSVNGVMELMISALALSSEQFGITQVSLNFAVFRSVFAEGARIGAGPVLRTGRGALLFLSRWWQLEALYRSNVKYQPEWVPRLFLFGDYRQLPRIAVAAALAEGFLPRFGREHSARTGIRRAAPDSLVGLQPDGSAPAPPEPEPGPARPRYPEQVRVRMDKLDRMTAAGLEAYPVAYPPTHSVTAARNSPRGTTVRVCGRLLRLRDYGGVVFAVLRDWTDDIQLLIDRERVGAGRCAEFGESFDLGDLIEVSGQLGYSRRGELSLLAADWRMLGKCLHPLPDKWKGMADPGYRVRHRYVDLMVNSQVREVLSRRSAVVRSLRDSLNDWGFLEVETPILQQMHGGANAAPFRTHIDAYDLDLSLRIAPELYLKRLCIGGVEKVFELGRAFRNEGVDFSHNSEFTMLEAYEAHSGYERMMHLCRQLIQNAAVAANQAMVAIRPKSDGTSETIDISGEWPVKTVHGAVSQALDTEISVDTDLPMLRQLCADTGIDYQHNWDEGQVVLEMYEHLVEARTQEPTFYIDFPTSVSPLTRAHSDAPGLAQRWDLVAWGLELGTAYSELTDPREQRRRLTEQSMLAAGGDTEAMELDEDFLEALEYAMPPTGGLGLGVDRVVMLVTGRSMRDTLPFPLVKPL